MKKKTLGIILFSALMGLSPAAESRLGKEPVKQIEKQDFKRASIAEIFEYCSCETKYDSVSYFEKKLLKTGHNLYVIFGFHYSEYALNHLYIDVAPDVTKDPENWLFLVEGAISNTGPENCFALALADKYNIHVDDIIVCDFELEVINAVKKQGFSEDEIYTRLLANEYKPKNTLPPLENIFPLENISPLKVKVDSMDYAVKTIAGRTGKNRNYLNYLMQIHVDIFTKETQKDKTRKAHLDQTVLDVRNQMSKKNLEQILQDASTPQNVLLVMGGAHYCIIEDLQKQ